MKQTSGFDALIEALKQSGVNVDGRFDADHEAPSGGAGRAGGGGGGAQPPHVNVEIPFADRMASWGKRALIVAAIVIILVGLGAYWWFHPPINIHSTDTWMFVAVFILLPLFLLFWSKSHSYKNGTGKVEPNEGKAKAFKWASYLPVLVAVVGVLGAVASLSIFPGNAAKYANVLQTETETFADDIKEVNYSEIPVIDRSSAILLGNREMGLHPRLRQPVRDLAAVQPDQLPERPGAREPACVRRPVQVVHEPRRRHPGVCAREHDDAGRRDRAARRQPHLLLGV